MRHDKATLLLRLARALAASAEGYTLDDMAAFAGCNRRTAERMRDALRDTFPQMEEVAEGSVKRFRIPAGLDGFMQAPTADELAELHAAAAALEAAGGLGRAALLRELAAKITGSLRAKVRTRLAPDVEALIRAEGHATQVGPRPLADAAVLGTIRAALKAGAGLAFSYAPDAARVRIVSPWGLLYGWAYYLVGPEAGMAGPVLWRLDRMTGLRLEGVATLPPAGWTIGDYAAQSFGVFQETPVPVVLLFSAQAAADAERFLFHPGQVMHRQEDGSLRVGFTAGGMRELATHLFGWGTEVQVLAPEGLRAELRDRLAAALAHHGGAGAVSQPDG